MTTIPVLNATGATVNVELPLTPGRSAAATSRPIALSTEDAAALALLATAAQIGEVQASPTANTLLDRLKTIATALAGTLTVASHAVTNAGTFAVQAAATLAAETTKVIGVVRNADGAGNLLTSTGNALDINLKSGGTPVGTGADIAGALVTFSTEGKASIGALTETAPASDTASSGLNGRLQRIAQRLTSLIGLLPAALGAGGGIKIDGSGTALPVSALPTLSAAANGLTASRVTAAGSTNATSLKASAGNIGRIDVFNVAAYNVFLKLYDKASAPTVGTDTPIMTIPVQAGGGYSAEFTRGKSFATGIAYAITKLQADSDTTVVVAGDLTGNITWI